MVKSVNKYLCIILTVLFVMLCNPFVIFVHADETLIDPSKAAEDAEQVVHVDEHGNPVTDVPSSETEAPQTSIVTVTDEEGNPVTDADGNPVTEIVTLASSEEGESSGEIGAETTVTEMEGQFETRELQTSDLQALERIRKELEQEKKNSFSETFGVILTLAGIIIIIYTIVVLLAYLFDKINVLPDFDLVRFITFGNAMTLRDEEDKEYAKSNDNKIYFLTSKTVIITFVIGILAGIFLLNTDRLLYIVNYIYQMLTNNG